MLNKPEKEATPACGWSYMQHFCQHFWVFSALSALFSGFGPDFSTFGGDSALLRNNGALYIATMTFSAYSGIPLAITPWLWYTTTVAPHSVLFLW